MAFDQIVVKYHNPRMLLTVDLESLFMTLFDAYGDGVKIEFSEMDEREKGESSEIVEGGIRAVRERFQIIEKMVQSEARRRKDLEQLAIAVGRK